MLTYNMDVEKGSLWLRTTPSAAFRSLPFFCTEVGIFYARDAFSTARTNKDSYLLFFTLEGKGAVSQYGETVTVGPGEALLIDCRTPQSYETSPDSNKWVHYWAHIDGEGVKAMFPMINKDDPLNIISVPKDAFTAQFDIFLKHLESDNAETMLQLSLSIHTLLTLMASEDLYRSMGSPTAKNLITSSAAYIRLHCCEKLDLDSLYQKTNLSKSYYMRLFKRYIGMAPYSYLLSCRITKAKELLECSDDSINVIAEKTGFLDASAFSVRFSAITGENPLHYRQHALRRNTQAK